MAVILTNVAIRLQVGNNMRKGEGAGCGGGVEFYSLGRNLALETLRRESHKKKSWGPAKPLAVKEVIRSARFLGRVAYKLLLSLQGRALCHW